MSEELARTALPTHEWKLRKDFYNNRWLVSHPLLGRLSRSWTMYGDVQAVSMCLNFAWKQEMDVNSRIGPIPCDWVAQAPWKAESAAPA